jgi:hypothetical protein
MAGEHAAEMPALLLRNLCEARQRLPVLSREQSRIAHGEDIAEAPDPHGPVDNHAPCPIGFSAELRG